MFLYDVSPWYDGSSPVIYSPPVIGRWLSLWLYFVGITMSIHHTENPCLSPFWLSFVCSFVKRLQLLFLRTHVHKATCIRHLILLGLICTLRLLRHFFTLLWITTVCWRCTNLSIYFSVVNNIVGAGGTLYINDNWTELSSAYRLQKLQWKLAREHFSLCIIESLRM